MTLYDLDSARLKTILGAFSRARVLVLGDLMADEYLTGEVSRISREAPVLILKHLGSKVYPGGASNTAANIASLGGLTHMAGLVGEDLMAERLLAELRARGVRTEGCLADPTRPTTTKSRISAASQQTVTQQIVRLDTESSAPADAEREDALVAALARLAPDLDVILLSDYGNGVLTPRVVDAALRVASEHGVRLTVDSQGDLSRFKGATVLTPNQPEAEAYVGFAITDAESLGRAGAKILEDAQAEGVLITRGGSGMALFTRDGGRFEIPAFNKAEVFDVTGAGDTVVGTFSTAVAAGASLREATVLANLAASIVVRRFGTSVTTPAEMARAWEALAPATQEGQPA